MIRAFCSFWLTPWQHLVDQGQQVLRVLQQAPSRRLGSHGSGPMNQSKCGVSGGPLPRDVKKSHISTKAQPSKRPDQYNAASGNWVLLGGGRHGPVMAFSSVSHPIPSSLQAPPNTCPRRILEVRQGHRPREPAGFPGCRAKRMIS